MRIWLKLNLKFSGDKNWFYSRIKLVFLVHPLLMFLLFWISISFYIRIILCVKFMCFLLELMCASILKSVYMYNLCPFKNSYEVLYYNYFLCLIYVLPFSNIWGFVLESFVAPNYAFNFWIHMILERICVPIVCGSFCIHISIY